MTTNSYRNILKTVGNPFLQKIEMGGDSNGGETGTEERTGIGGNWSKKNHDCIHWEKGSVPPAGQETLFPPSFLDGRWVPLDMFLHIEPAKLLY